MLFWCPIGVRKAQDAPIATAIRKGSAATPSWLAVPMATGHITAAVPALLGKGHLFGLSSERRP